MPDVFTILMDDHRSVERLFDQYQGSCDRALAEEICNQLTAHTQAEDEMVYGLLGAKVSPSLANEARREHSEAAQIIEQIDAGLRRGTDVSSLMSELQAAVSHHVQEEESEIFPTMRKKLPSLVEAMGEEVATRREEIMAEVQQARSLGEPSGVVATRPPGH